MLKKITVDDKVTIFVKVLQNLIKARVNSLQKVSMIFASTVPSLQNATMLTGVLVNFIMVSMYRCKTEHFLSQIMCTLLILGRATLERNEYRKPRREEYLITN